MKSVNNSSAEALGVQADYVPDGAHRETRQDFGGEITNASEVAQVHSSASLSPNKGERSGMRDGRKFVRTPTQIMGN